MSNFTKRQLSGERVLITGTDGDGNNGSTVVSSAEWTSVLNRTEHNDAVVDFEAKVEAFFAPLTEAAEALEQATNPRVFDAISYVVIEEGTEGTPARSEEVIKLSKDSVILRLLDEGQEDRLIWVNDELEVLEVLPGTSSVTSED